VDASFGEQPSPSRLDGSLPRDLESSRTIIESLCEDLEQPAPPPRADARRLLLHHLTLLADSLEEPERDFRRNPSEESAEVEEFINNLSVTFAEVDRLYGDLRCVFRKVDRHEWDVNLQIQLRELSGLYIDANAALKSYHRNLNRGEDDGQRESLATRAARLVYIFYDKLSRIADHYRNRGY
jgi:hypothetical protein